MLVNFRQGIVNAEPTFLSISGNNINILADASPCIINFAHGKNDYLHIENESVTNAWSGPFTQTTWLYWDIDLVTGIRTFGKTLITPTFGATDPSNPQTNQHFFNQKEMRMKVWIGNRWEQKIRVFAGSVLGSTITQNTFNSQINVIGERNVGTILFDSTGSAIKYQDVENRKGFYTTESLFNTQNNTLTTVGEESLMLFKSGVTIPKYSAVTIDSSGLLNLASSALMTECNGISTRDIYRDKFGTFISSGYIKNLEWNFTSPPNTPLWVGNNGEITTTIPTRWSLQKIGFIVDSTTIFVKIEELMLIDGTLSTIDPTPTPTPTVTVTPTVTPTPTIWVT